MKLFDDLARLWWVRVPALLGRISGLLTSLASDGAYLRAWPAAAALAPIGCLLFGLLAGWTHFSNSYIALSYTNSLLLMALLTLISGLGGGLGLYLLIGYIFGDFLLFGHGEYMGAPSAQIMARLALPIAYLLLGKLLILAPVVSRGLRLQLLDKLRLSGTAGTIAHAAVQAALQAALVWVWVQAAPTLIRPIYTWRGGAPTSEAMAPLQESGMLLVALALLIGAVRVVIERLPSAQRAAADARRDLCQTRTGARAQDLGPEHKHQRADADAGGDTHRRSDGEVAVAETAAVVGLGRHRQNEPTQGQCQPGGAKHPNRNSHERASTVVPAGAGARGVAGISSANTTIEVAVGIMIGKKVWVEFQTRGTSNEASAKLTRPPATRRNTIGTRAIKRDSGASRVATMPRSSCPARVRPKKSTPSRNVTINPASK